MRKMIIVFYDGACGMCSKEIAHYRQIAPKEVFEWRDVNECGDELEKEQISLADALKLLHVKDENGQMHVGVDAFILIWRHLKWWRFLAIFASMPVVKQLLKIVYLIFAKWRFSRLTHCQMALKKRDKL